MMFFLTSAELRAELALSAHEAWTKMKAKSGSIKGEKYTLVHKAIARIMVASWRLEAT